MNKTNIKPEEPEEEEEAVENLNPEENSEEEIQKHGRRRKRIKVRRRIRIKKRTSPKKKAKKTMETVAWVLIIAAFVMTLIILILQLDLKDRRTKKSQGKEVSMIEKNEFTVYSLHFTVLDPNNCKL